jgi:hypothetical protein
MVITQWQVKNRAFLAILLHANRATSFSIELLLLLTQYFQIIFGKSAVHTHIPL